MLGGLAYKLTELSTAINTLVTEYEKLDSGINAYTEGVSEILAGYSQVSDGATKLVTGSGTLKNGTETLYSGTSDLLSGIVKEMMQTLLGGKNAISNQELVQNLNNAKEAHKNWVNNLRRIADEMRTYPLQINGSKCAFGHFYNSIDINHPAIEKEWGKIDSVHKELHSFGQKVIDAVKNSNSAEAKEYLHKAEDMSESVLLYLDKVISEVEEQNKLGVQVLRSENK